MSAAWSEDAQGRPILDLRAEGALNRPALDDLPELTPDERAMAVRTWRGRMVNEHASAQVFAGLVPQLMRAALPGALQAEVPDPADPGTAMNQSLLARLDRADTLLIAGEAGSHCVRASVEHLVEHLPSGRPDRLVLLTDCISPVAGFEAEQAEFLAAMAARGVRLARSTELALR